MESLTSRSGLRGWLQQPFFQVGFPVATVPLALLVLCLLSYGAMLSRLGLHFDDWSLVWVIHFLGPLEFTKAYLVDRPLLGWLMALTASLFGENLLAWQFFGIAVRWLSCVSLWWLLRGIWPRRTLETTGVALLFAVYPGFISIHIPVTRAHHILILALTLFSLGALDWALRKRAWFWALYIASIVTMALSIFTMEYYFGLELLRPLFIWLILSETITQFCKRLSQAALYYLPFGLVLLSFIVWRIVTPTERGAVTLADKILTSPISGGIAFIYLVLQDLWEASALAWGQVFKPGLFLAGYDAKIIVGYIVIVTGAALLSSLFLTRLQQPPPASTQSPTEGRWALQTKRVSSMIGIGALALILGGIPVWVTNLHLELAFPWDRFTIAMMMGVSLLLFGLLSLLNWLFLRGRQKWLLILLTSILVGLGAGYQFHVALTIRRDWQSQKDFFWQLAWRAPKLHAGTALLVTELPFTYSNGYALTAPLNWMYAPHSDAYALPYVIYDARQNFSEANLQAISDQQTVPIQAENRMLYFHGSTAQAVFVVYRPPACLKVIDPTKDQAMPEKPRLFRELLALSNLSLIASGDSQPAQPPARFFGSSADVNWCYFFEKADLARQMGDWRQVVELGDQAMGEASNSTPDKTSFEKTGFVQDQSELIPFILGYGHTGEWQKAVELTNRAYRADKKLRLMLCDAWGSLKQPASANAQGQSAYDDLHQQLQCGS